MDNLDIALGNLSDKLDSIEAEMDAASRQINKDLVAFTAKWYGERCPDYEPDCPCCKAWHIVDQFVEFNDYISKKE